MSYFDLLFLASVPLSIVALIVAAFSAFRGRRRRAANILRGLGAYVAVYAFAALFFDFVLPQDTVRMGEPWCFDHWCLVAESVQSVPDKADMIHSVKLRFFNSSHRVVQWAANAWIYLIDDENGHLYPPEPDSSAAPLDMRLQPQQAVTTTRVFRVPATAKYVGLVTGHGGAYCGIMSKVIIGQGGCLFKKPKMIRIIPPGGL